jgi:hypothetical protein
VNAKDFFRRDVPAVFLNDGEFAEPIQLNGVPLLAVVEDGESALQAESSPQERAGLRSAGTMLANIGEHPLTLHLAAADFPRPSAGQKLILRRKSDCRDRILRVVSVIDCGDTRSVSAVEITH